MLALPFALVRSRSLPFAPILPEFARAHTRSLPLACAQVLWWEPMYGKYSKTWRKWCDDTTKVQHKSTIKRNIIYYTNAKWTQPAPLKYGYHNLGKRSRIAYRATRMPSGQSSESEQ